MGKMQFIGWRRDCGDGCVFWNERQIVVPDVMLFNFVKLTLSLIKP